MRANDWGSLPPARGRITEVTPSGADPAMDRCKIAAGSSVRRRYETTCCFPSAGRFECCVLDAGSSSEHHYRRKHAPGPAGGQAPAKSVEEVSQETTESHEEIRDSATEADQEVETSHSILIAVSVLPWLQRFARTGTWRGASSACGFPIVSFAGRRNDVAGDLTGPGQRTYPMLRLPRRMRSNDRSHRLAKARHQNCSSGSADCIKHGRASCFEFRNGNSFHALSL